MAELKGSKYYTVVTDIGQAKIANSIYSGKKLDLTLLKLGDGNGAFYNPDSSQTDVKKEVWRGNVVDVEIDAGNPNWINIYTVIAPTDGGFTIREMAVFDSDGDMIGICNCAESYKPTLDEGSGKEITMKMTLAVVNTSAITLKIDPTIIYAKRKDVLELQTKVNEITKQINNLENDSYPIVEATGANAYIGASARIKAVGKGTRCTLFVGTASNGNCSLNLNNSGAVAIKDSNGNIVTNMKANIPYNLCHNGSDFILQGKGGGGNLIPKYLLAGYYGEGDNGRVDGAMVNRGAPTSNLNCGGVVNLQEGYYAGGQIIANSLASQTPANATAAQILAGYSAWVNGIKISGNATIQSLGGSTFVSGTGSVTLTEKQSRILVDFSAKVPSTVRVIWGKFTSGSSFYFVNFRSETSGTFKPIVWDKYYSKYADENPVAITGINLGDGDSSHTWSAGTYTYTWYAI
ncbi:phage tail protein [Clostridium butyricum]|uniref:phage tail protein n=1 Tax=Clostridium butyricum TaxID=1492 RepID=UPI00129B294C|nr:phage tail protein [Clostridium butyricum]QGH21810.1 phage tail protein [Clostridium butyricum]QGH25849.1 phage tail protein [Clostridium butyricum]